MRKLLVFTMLTFLVIFSKTIDVSAKNSAELDAEKFHSEIQETKSEWTDTELDKGIKILDVDDKSMGTLYRVVKDDIRKGYIVYIDGECVVEATSIPTKIIW